MMLLVTGWLSARWDLGFTVSGFWAAFWGGLVVGLVSLVLSMALPEGKRDGVAHVTPPLQYVSRPAR